MKHYNLVTTYNKATDHFNRGNYGKSKRLFQYVLFEITSSDTECMADIGLANSCQDFIDEMEHELHTESSKISFRKVLAIIFGIIISALLIFAVIKLLS